AVPPVALLADLHLSHGVIPRRRVGSRSSESRDATEDTEERRVLSDGTWKFLRRRKTGRYGGAALILTGPDGPRAARHSTSPRSSSRSRFSTRLFASSTAFSVSPSSAATSAGLQPSNTCRRKAAQVDGAKSTSAARSARAARNSSWSRSHSLPSTLSS